MCARNGRSCAHPTPLSFARSPRPLGSDLQVWTQSPRRNRQTVEIYGPWYVVLALEGGGDTDPHLKPPCNTWERCLGRFSAGFTLFELCDHMGNLRSRYFRTVSKGYGRPWRLKALAASLLTTSFNLVCTVSAPGPADEFKSFLSEKPAFGSITFTVTFANRTSQFYRYTWNGDSYLVQQPADPRHFDRDPLPLETTVLAGCDGRFHWRLRSDPGVGPNLLTWDSHTDKDFPENAVTVDARTLRFHPTTALCMGIMHLEPGSVRWTGNSLEAVKGKDESWQGTLSTNAAGLPRSLHVTRIKDAVRRYEISFDYSESMARDVPDWMPKRIQLALVEEGGRLRNLQYYEVLEMSLSPPLHSFDPEFLLAGQAMAKGMVRSNEIYLARHGQMRRLLRPEEVPRINDAPDRTARPYALFLLAAVILAPLWFVRRAARSRKT